MRAAATAESLNQYTPDLIEPLRDAAASAFGRARDQGFEVVGTEGTQAAVALALMATVDPGDEVIVSDPGYFHIPSAVLAAGGVPVAVPISSGTGFRLDPDDVARAITPRTRAICIVDPLNPYGTVQTRDELTALAELADRHGLLLIHDVTHAPLALDPDVPFASLPALELTDRAVAAMSVSHCYGMAGARIGFLGGPPGFVRGCLQLKAALTRLNTNLISQRGALAAFADDSYLARAERTIRANLAHLEETLDDVPGVRLAVRPAARARVRARRVRDRRERAGADGGAVRAPRRGLSGRRPGRHRRREHDPRSISRVPTRGRWSTCAPCSADAVAEAASGRWRDDVVSLLERKGTERAARLARQIGGRA